jgi:hypothetical protein
VHARVQRLVSVVKMETVLEEYPTEEQSSVVRLLWVKRHSAKDVHKEIFRVYCGKCLSLKAVHDWVEKFSQGRSNITDGETKDKRLLCCGFRRNGKAMGQVYQYRWRIRREMNVFFFQVRISHVLLFITICDLFTDSCSYIPSVSTH